MRYFEVESEAQAAKISSELFKLMYRDGSNASGTHLFTWVTLAGVVLILIDENTICPVFQKESTDQVLETIKTEYGQKITENEKQSLETRMKNQSTVNLIDLIPAGLTEYSAQWVQDHTPPLNPVKGGK